MGAAGLNVLPVVNRFNVHKMTGVVRLSDILTASRMATQVTARRPEIETPKQEGN